MADLILATRGLQKTYRGRVDTPVLHGIDLEIPRGSFTALIGPSGSGKSTLLHCLGLLDPQTAGEIEFDGRIITARNVNELAGFRNENIGFVFQFHYLLPEFTAYENVLLPAWIGRGRPGPETEQEALRIMERIGVAELKDKSVSEISGGQQQRVAIARALVNHPQLVLADEPTGNLDRESGRAVLDLLSELNRESRTSMVMVTHDREIALHADHVYELLDGRICRHLDMSRLKKEDAAKALEDRSCTLN